jgi:hypothetical protein
VKAISVNTGKCWENKKTGIKPGDEAMKENKDTKIPEFKTLEEEREYWEARGPLAEGHKGTINKPKSRQKRSSFLAVRLTGEELTRLRDVAAKQGLGPSTFARIALTSAIERQSQPDSVTLAEIKNMMENFLSQSTMDNGKAVAKRR